MEQIPVTNVTAKGERQESTEVHLQDQLADLNLNKTLQAETTAQPAAVSTVTKIFVGGLLSTTTPRSLREFFEQVGQIDEAVVKAEVKGYTSAQGISFRPPTPISPICRTPLFAYLTV